MSLAPVDLSSQPPTEHRPPSLPLDESRGSWAMALTILTEAFLFISLFSSYFFLAIGKHRWDIEDPPKLHWRGRKEYMALAGVFISITLGIGIVWLSIPISVLNICARQR
jgi:heme/copper-type cytochrome/quinol oxidase subunit 3